jgi:hypothetical protein
MDFQQLLAKMVELDQPTAQVQEATPVLDQPIEECPSDMTSPMAPAAPSVPEPSMSLNLNAQGMDNIESLMKLMTKVNPDMINQPSAMSAPAVSPMPSLTPPGPGISSIGDLGDLDKGPLKMLPDLDSDDGEEGPEEPEDNDKIDVIDLDNDEKDDGEEEPEDDEEKKEWANEPDESEQSIDYMNNKLAGGMNRPKGTHPKVAGADNPMQRVKEGTDLRAQIRAELQQRLAEAKGAK